MNWKKIISILIPILVALAGGGYTVVDATASQRTKIEEIDRRINTCEEETKNIRSIVTQNGKGISKILGYLNISEN